MSSLPEEKKVKSGLETALPVWLAPAEVFQPHLGPRDNGERRSSQGPELGVVCIVYFT